MRVDVLVVGAGFSGSVVAERLASHGRKVLIIDKRPHIGGNAYDKTDEQGILIHPYGPHIFHTNGMRIARYLSQFTEWRPYEHRVRAKVADRFVPIPINIETVNQVYGLSLTEQTIGAFFESVREPREVIRTSEDVVLNAVGRDLYEKFFRGYTRKQWGLDPSELAASVAARIPVRTNHDDRYFTDAFQHMIEHGRRILAAEVGGWYDCGKLDTLLETNETLLRQGHARRRDFPGVTIVDPVLIEDGVTVERSTIGPNVTLEAGTTVADSRLEHTLVGRDSRITGSVLTHSMLGNGVAVEGFTGSLSLGDHSELRSKAR